MSTLFDGFGNQIAVGSSTGIQNVTAQTKFEDFKTTGWYAIPSTWYELILATFKLATTYSMPYGGLLRVMANDSGNYIRYWFYPSSVHGRSLDVGLTSNTYGYNAYGYEQSIEGFWYPNNDANITWRKGLSTLTDTIQGKTILLMGDSIPAGFSGLPGFATKHDCTVVSKCIGGTSVAYRTEDKSNEWDDRCLVALTDATITSEDSQHYLDIEGADAGVIWQGTNDYGNKIPLGAIAAVGGEFDDMTMIGALQHSIENILARNPSINLMMLTPMYRYCYTPEQKEQFESYVDAVMDVAHLYNIPCKNMLLDCGVNDLNRSGFMDAGGLHPSTPAGMAMIRAKYEHWIEQNM